MLKLESNQILRIERNAFDALLIIFNSSFTVLFWLQHSMIFQLFFPNVEKSSPLLIETFKLKWFAAQVYVEDFYVGKFFEMLWLRQLSYKMQIRISKSIEKARICSSLFYFHVVWLCFYVGSFRKENEGTDKSIATKTMKVCIISEIETNTRRTKIK